MRVKLQCATRTHEKPLQREEQLIPAGICYSEETPPKRTLADEATTNHLSAEGGRLSVLRTHVKPANYGRQGINQHVGCEGLRKLSQY